MKLEKIKFEEYLLTFDSEYFYIFYILKIFIICTLHQIPLGNQIKGDGLGVTCGAHGGVKKFITKLLS
jgi:hypothetical protein